MTLPKGRVLKAEGTALRNVAAIVPAPSSNSRIVKSAAVDAARDAAARLESAEQEAKRVIAEAEQLARKVREEARDLGRNEGAAELAAAWIKLRTAESTRMESELDRSVELARAMAERLLGEALRLEPSTVVALAREALASASRARRIAISAHPEDAIALRAHLASLSLDGAAVEIHPDPVRLRGSLLFDTDLGILDADLSIQLDRLARSLRDALRS